jgi:hypothetical protein
VSRVAGRGLWRGDMEGGGGSARRKDTDSAPSRCLTLVGNSEHGQNSQVERDNDPGACWFEPGIERGVWWRASLVKRKKVACRSFETEAPRKEGEGGVAGWFSSGHRLAGLP